MRLLLLRRIWEAFEMIHASVENRTRNFLGEINLTVLHMIALLMSILVFLALLAIPYWVFSHFGSIAGAVSIVGVIAAFFLFVRSGARTCPHCGSRFSDRVIVCPLCDHDFRDA